MQVTCCPVYALLVAFERLMPDADKRRNESPIFFLFVAEHEAHALLALRAR